MRRVFRILLEEKQPALYISILLGVLALVITVLPLLGIHSSDDLRNFDFSVPMGVLGIITGVFAWFRCRNKKIVWFAICLNGVPIAFLLLVVGLLICAGPNAFKQ
jgi:hypothetical protein